MNELFNSWQASQMSYPRDADYDGAKVGISDLQADQLIGELDAGDTFIYLFRRFGYPRFGWDGFKKLVQYHITTPMPGVVLTVEPAVAGGGTFGYMLREDIHRACMEEDRACMEEDRKPHREWYRRCEAWALEKKGIELVSHCEQDDDKLQRVWRAWATAHEANEFEDQKGAENMFWVDQADLRSEYTDRYSSIHPRPRLPRIENRPDGSIVKQCHAALCAAITDLLRPVQLRDVMINIQGRVMWSEVVSPDSDLVKCAAGSGRGVGAFL